MRIFTVSAFVLAAFTVTGCGDTMGEQALIGAGAGTAGAAVTKGDMFTGAVLGAAANVAYCKIYPDRC